MMNKEAVWSQEYGSYVSRTFLPEKERIKISNLVKINLRDCNIIISLFGFYELWIKDKKLKSITFDEYLSYRNYVKEVIQEVHYE